jgi:hypothetical protein
VNWGCFLLPVWFLLLIAHILFLAHAKPWLHREILPTARHTPVVYLRPFEVDRRNHWYEHRIVRALKKLGPVVTVGRPDEELPATPRMAHEYLLNQEWQHAILDLIGRAQLVVVHIGVSRGLAWELDQIRRQGRPKSLFFG